VNRRGFLGSILALGAAPAIVRADSLMRIIPRDSGIIRIDQTRGGDFEFYDGLKWRKEDLDSLRAQAKRRLAEWYQDNCDQFVFNRITGVKQ